MKVPIKSHNKIFQDTLNVYRDALGFIVGVVNNEWEDICDISDAKKRLNYVEKLIHKTKYNKNPEYTAFDTLFYKFPGYFRRSATAKAVGIVSSYRSNLANYEEKLLSFQKQGKPLKERAPSPALNYYAFPVFYKGNMYQNLSSNQSWIKVFKDNDWVWITIEFDDRNLRNRQIETYKECNPSLVKSRGKFYLHIPFEKGVSLNETPLEERKVIAVDLGLTNSAVCCAMKSDGTIVDRLFINQPIEKDRMLHRLGRLKAGQKQSCINSKNELPNYWRKINDLQKHIVNNTSHKIIKFAEKHDADVIVFEHLGKFKIQKGTVGHAKRIRERLQFWAKMKIQKKTEEKAHHLGMRCSRVSPKNTSALAYDGSGKVKRNPKKDLCTFTSGKVYHSDLNAAYNIGARYFVREKLKTFSEKRRSVVLAKVPELQTRTRCTLASLINLAKAM